MVRSKNNITRAIISSPKKLPSIRTALSLIVCINIGIRLQMYLNKHFYFNLYIITYNKYILCNDVMMERLCNIFMYIFSNNTYCYLCLIGTGVICESIIPIMYPIFIIG